jgi:hypothetical protein
MIQDPDALQQWYRDHLGVVHEESAPWNQEAGPTMIMPFADDSDYFPAGTRPKQDDSLEYTIPKVMRSSSGSRQSLSFGNQQGDRAGTISLSTPLDLDSFVAN